MSLITEAEFVQRLDEALSTCFGQYDWVSGPGRSGAMAAVYASHKLGIPYIPFGFNPRCGGYGLMIDIEDTSYTRLERAARRYTAAVCLLFEVAEGQRPQLWYQSTAAATTANVRVFMREDAA